MNFGQSMLMLSIVLILLSVNNAESSERVVAITDNGQASHQELKPAVERIKNYNLTNL